MALQYKKSAFTLAEVLITLLIIGVVASLVIPNIINDSKDVELNIALKKVYAELSLVTKQIIMDNGGTFAGLLISDTDHTGLRNLYASKLSYIKSCRFSRDEGCWHPLSTNGGNWKQYSGNSTDSSVLGTGLILNNGILINFIVLNSSCSYMGSYYTKPSICGWVIVDVNGFKNPNITGKDIFYFNILFNKFEPWGAPDSSYHTCDGTGFYCTALKLMQ